MILALSGGQKTALVIMAAIFIGFALASSFLFPRSDPDYPGKRLPLFILVSIGLFVAMLTAMVVFAKESEEPGAGEPEAAATEPAPGSTTGETAPANEPQGDAAAGKDVFASAGCTGCHTLADSRFEREPRPDRRRETALRARGRPRAGRPGCLVQGPARRHADQSVAAYVSASRARVELRKERRQLVALGRAELERAAGSGAPGRWARRSPS